MPLKRGLTILVILLIFAAPEGTVFASLATTAFQESVDAYNQGNYQQAIDGFSKLADHGLKNEKLAYNLGNAYLKNGDLGHAILWYERARFLAPTDPEIAFNLNYAKSLLKDETVEKENILVNVFFFWKSFLSPRTIQLFALITNGLFWLALAIRLIRRRSIIRVWLVLALLGIVLFTPTALYQTYQDAVVVNGVILPEEQPVRSGLNKESSTLFILHAGTIVRVEDLKNDYVRIEYTPEKIGWIPRDAVGEL